MQHMHLVPFRHEPPDKIGADESRPAGHQNTLIGHYALAAKSGACLLDNRGVQRKSGLRLVKLAGAQKSVRGRMISQRQAHEKVGAFARPAAIHGFHSQTWVSIVVLRRVVMPMMKSANTSIM